MQELLGRIARLDPSASLGLRVIACFDELVVGNVNTRALLAAAASLAACTAGFAHESGRTVRVTARGELAPPPPRDSTPGPFLRAEADGLAVWLEREGEPLANDAIILERLALAVRIRHGRGRAGADNRRDVGVVVDGDLPDDQRAAAAGALGLSARRRYRVVAAPLFAVWNTHPNGVEDVVPTRHGPLHVLIVPEGLDTLEASPAGVGVSVEPHALHRSFRTAMVALRLCDPPRVPVVCADMYGGVIDLLAEAAPSDDQPDVEDLDLIMDHPWGRSTIEAIIGAQSVRQAARAVEVHHSTMQSRLELIKSALGYDPFDGYGKPRLGVAYLGWRLRRSRVLDLPAPAEVGPRCEQHARPGRPAVAAGGGG